MMKKPFTIAAALMALGACIWGAQVAYMQQNTPLSELPFSPARQAGDTLYLSGQIARTPEGVDITESIEAETHQIMKNLGAILEEHGYTFDDVVQATVYLKDMNDYQAMNKVYASYFDGTFPARETTGGHEIAFGMRAEISMIAHKNQ